MKPGTYRRVYAPTTRGVVSVGLDGHSQPMWRYRDELALPDYMRSIVSAVLLPI